MHVWLRGSVIVASRIVWGFAVTAPPTTPSAHFELVHVSGLVDAVQYCRIQLADREVFVLFLNGAARGDARVQALAAHFPEAPFAVVFEDSRDRSRAFGAGVAGATVAGCVGLAKCHGSLDDPWQMVVDVEGVVYDVAPGFQGRQWFCQTTVV